MPSLTSSERILLWALGCLFGLFTFALACMAVSTGNYLVLAAIPAIILGSLAIVVFVYLAPVAIHEGGHYLAGKMVGYKFKGVVIGPFSWKRSGGRTTFKFDRSVQHGLMLMDAGDAPVSKGGSVFYVLGGPLANLLIAAISAGSAFLLLPVGSEGRPILLTFAGINGIGLLSIVSKKGPTGHSSDRVLLGYLLGGGALKMSAAAKRIAAEPNIPPRDWDADAVRVLSEPVGPPGFRAWAHRIVFHHHLDSRRFDEARKYLEGGLTFSNDVAMLRTDVMVDLLLEGAAYYAGRHGDAQRARQLLDQVPKCPPIFLATARRALIALDYAEGRRDRADRRLARALRSAQASSQTGSATECAYLELIREWLPPAQP